MGLFGMSGAMAVEWDLMDWDSIKEPPLKCEYEYGCSSQKTERDVLRRAAQAHSAKLHDTKIPESTTQTVKIFPGMTPI